MEFENFLDIRKFSLRNDYYCFVDTGEYLADGLFVRNRVRVDFKREFAKEGDTYRLIYCRARKKDRERFLDALEQLKNKMLLCGHTDYGEFCMWFQTTLRQMKEGNKKMQENEKIMRENEN